MEARSYIGIIRPYDDEIIEDRDFTAPIIRQMDDNYHSTSDNIDNQRLHTKVNQGVVSAVCPRDRTFSQLNKQAKHP